MKKSPILLCAVFFTMALASPREAMSCSCGNMSSVLDMFEKSEHVLIAKITAVNVVLPERYSFGPGTIVVTVEKTYKGGRKPGEVIEFLMPGSSCDYQFYKEDVGEEFLLYYNEPQNDSSLIPALSICQRINNLKKATEDTLYLDNLSKVRGKTRISGSLTGSPGNPAFDGRKILIRRGDNSWELTTNSAGVFEIYDLPPGEYEIEAELPDKWKYSSTSSSQLIKYDPENRGRRNSVTLNLRVEDRKHTSLEIWLVPDSAISGQVLSPSGQPMERVFVYMDRVSRMNNSAFTTTGKNGEFSFEIGAEDEYVIVVNRRGDIVDIPFRTFYYPGVDNREKAEIFSITAGTSFKDIIFRIPEFEKTIQLSATVLYSDGKTVDNAMTFLTLTPEGKSEEIAISLSENGIHNTGIHKGFAGKLAFNTSAGSGDFLNCPVIENILREDFENKKQKASEINAVLVLSNTKFRSDEIWISGEGDVTDIRLHLPIPYCERSVK